ncbi:MAG: hypothetical protein M3362_10720 [Acidobacteriota bacterium]|nr:hypothetical protein [Acidobacteriota bacterium]
MRLTTLLACLLALCTASLAQQYSSDMYSGLRWRLIGPHRAGRVTAVAGVRGQPAIYYIGTPGGGVWKTTDGGRVWKPIFDDAHVASIGALALAPSNPDVIYVGTGEQTEGNGVYKSTDGGLTWTNVGLAETHYITSIIVDPKDPNIVLVGAFGDPLAGKARGVFKSTDGGKSWKQVLFQGDRVGIADMCAALGDGRVLYASTWSPRFGPNDQQQAESQIFKSTDGGATWQPVGGAGLPEKSRGRIGVAVAPGNRNQRVYAIMNQGFFRSDDGGASWKQTTVDPRVVGNGYFSRAFVDPQNADVVYVMQTSMYRSTDGGKTFEAYKGAPSGEDEHVLWIAPEDPKRMILGSDQGAVVSLDGGVTWTSWYNQPTGQFYHVSTDNTFPYHLYAAQQDSGSVVVPNRSDYGQITFRDWFSSGAFESGHIAPDPLNPNLIYSIGWYGTVLRLDRTTGQISTVFVPGPKYRYTWETPLVYSPTDPKTLYVGMQHLLKTTDGAQTWQEISPDLTALHAAPAMKDHASGGVDEDGPQAPEQGVIQAITPSAAAQGEIWVGTSTGLVQLTRDGGSSWSNVTPTEMPQRAQVILIEASPTDALTAYAIANVRGDSHPYIFRTRDAGKSWQKIVEGLPYNQTARVVREDPQRKGLVYAGNEAGVYVSFDGGDRWQSLQLNLPTSSVRDLNVHGSDLVAATYGRGLWILDDISPLRQLDAKVAGGNAYLFKPETAMRVRWDNWEETPLPADTPAGENPPDGSIIYYYLTSQPSKPITLEILDEFGGLVQSYSSVPPPADNTPGNAPDYWFAPPDVLPVKKGLNRFVWNLRFPYPLALNYNFRGRHIDYIEYTLPDNSVPGKTPRHQPPGPLVVPGKYEVVLTVNGKQYRQPLVVKLDPRVHVTQSDLDAQLSLAIKISQWMRMTYDAYNEIAEVRAALADRVKNLSGNGQVKDAAMALDKELTEIQEGTDAVAGFGTVNRDLARYIVMIESGDMRPAKSAQDVTIQSCESLRNALVHWNRVNNESLPALNKLLGQSRLVPLPAVKPAASLVCTD